MGFAATEKPTGDIAGGHRGSDLSLDIEYSLAIRKVQSDLETDFPVDKVVSDIDLGGGGVRQDSGKFFILG